MAILGSTALTLADWASRQDSSKGPLATIVDILSQANEMLEDILWLPCNDGSTHKTTLRTGLPRGTARPYNTGIPAEKSTTAQIIAACGNLSSRSTVDVALANRNGNGPAFRLSEDRAFMEGMAQNVAGKMIYNYAGTAPAEFTGLAPYYASATPGASQSAANVLDAGGVAATNTSVWLVCWGENTVHGIYPQGSDAGWKMIDKGTTWPGSDANGNPYEAYTTLFSWDLGLALRDWRYVVRACNIDVTQLPTTNAPNLINLLTRMLERPPRISAASTKAVTQPSGEVGSGDRAVIYANRVVRTWLRIQLLNKANALLTVETDQGRAILTFCGIPIKTSDQLLSTEGRVV